MKAVRFHEHGGPEVLRYEDIPEPEIRDDEVLIRVRACALNHLDLFVRGGIPGIRYHLPHILGADVAGEVVDIGDRCWRVKAGQRVLLAPDTSCRQCEWCLSGRDNRCAKFTVRGALVDGGYCEYMAVPEWAVVSIPDSLGFVDAAATPLVFLTAWHMLFDRAGLEAGDDVLVLGGSSGVGSAAIQIAKLFHCRVIATAGGEAKRARTAELGADFVIDHYQQKVGEEVRRITGKRGVDVVFEHVGAATWDQSMQSLAAGGRLVTCGATTGFDVKLDLRFLFSRQQTVMGSYMGTLGELHRVLKFVFAGKLKPVVDTTFPLAEAAEAHRRLENKEQFGKIVLTMD